MRVKSLNGLLAILLAISIILPLLVSVVIAKPVEPNPATSWPSGTIWGTRLRLENSTYAGDAWFGVKTGSSVKLLAPPPGADYMRPVFVEGASQYFTVDYQQVAAPQSYSWYVKLDRGGAASTNGAVSCDIENAEAWFVPPDFSVVLDNSAQDILVNLREENGHITSLPKYATLYVDNHVNLTIQNLDPLTGSPGAQLRLNVTVYNTGRYSDNFDVYYQVGGSPDPPVGTIGPLNPGENGSLTINTTIPAGVENIIVTADGWYADDVDYVTAMGLENKVELRDENGDFVALYDNIQAAIDAASPGYTVIAYPGTYEENLNVYKENLTVRSANGAAVTIVQTPNPNDQVFEVTADGVSIIGFTILDATNMAGVRLDYADHCRIENNTFENSYYGIYLYYSNYNTVLFNTISWHDYGFFVWYSDNNQIGNNDIFHTSQYNFGSCPFLYTWNGTEMELFGDINGAGGLGYRMDMSISGGGIEELRPPTSIDYTAIDGSDLVPKEGNYILEVAEEQDEIAYFDNAELWVIDHDPGVEIYSPEAALMTQTPYLYPPVIHTVRNPVSPISATDWNGNDILSVIASPDEVYTEAELLTDSFITLDLGDLSGASQIKLIYRAYTDWSPIGKVKANQYVEVKNALGEWELVSENEHFGKPEAMPRTWVIDITDWFKTDDWHLRLHTGTCKIHVDWIAVDTSVDEPVNVTVLQPTSANHYYKGPDKLGFEYFFGNFTKYGDVLPLVENADDKFVIMRVGDSIELKFAEQPAPVGERDFWFVTDSYFKQPFVKYLLGSDVSTVDPLPFHGMSNYPYPPSESYPSDSEHLAYLSEWNTREYVEGAGAGMSLPYSENNVVFGNTIIGDPSCSGLILEGEKNTRILNNTISNTGYGLSIYYSSGIFVSGNQISNNQNDGIYLEDSDNNFLYNNTCENNQYGIYLEDSDNNFLYYDNCDNNDFGIYLYYSDNNFIYNCIVENNEYHGILLNNSNNNGIYNCTARNNDESGITLDKPSDNNYVFGCTVSNNNNYGIWLDSSDNCAIEYNTIDNNGDGIYITGTTSFAWISFNNITNNTAGIPTSGIHIVSGVDATGIWVNYNNIVGNSPIGWSYGVYNVGTGVLNARYNWWGNASGPGGVGPGTGDNVSYDVDYRPWLPRTFENIVIGYGYDIISEGHNENISPVFYDLDGAPIPENVVVTLDSSENGWLTITVLENLGGAPIPENLLRAGMFIDISTLPENIAENIWITIHYTDEDVIGIDEENLKLYYWRENENWQLCENIDVDPANNTVKGFISHLTPFGMFGPPAPAPGVKVSISPREADTTPGWTLSYEVKVKNIGGITDNYALENSDTEGWILALDDDLFQNVAPNETRTTTLWVTIPDNATPCTEDNITVTATSQENATVSAENSCIAHAIQVKPVVPGPGTSWPSGTIWGTRLRLENGVYAGATWFGVKTGSTVKLLAPPPGPDYMRPVFVDNFKEYMMIDYKQVASPQSYSWYVKLNSGGATSTAGTASWMLENATHAFIPYDFSIVLENQVTGVLVNLREEDNHWFSLPAYAILYVDNAVNVEVENVTPTTAAGGKEIIFDVIVSNTGRYNDTYELSASDNLGWGLVLSPSTLSISAGQSKTATLTATVAKGGANDIMVTANGAYAFDYDTTTAFGLPIWVSISPSEDHGLRGETLIYTVTVKNIGEDADNYELEASDTENWSLALGVNLFENVAPGGSHMTTLSVTIPSGAVGGTKDNIIVTATSQENAEVSDSVTCTALADYLGVEVTIKPSSQGGALGTTLSYTVTVKNNGNVADNYDLAVSDGWSAQISPTSLAVPAGAKRTATLSVTIPSGASGGDSMRITVTATSQVDNAVSGSARCTATAEVPPTAPTEPEEEEEVPPPSPRLPEEDERGPFMLMGVAIFAAFLVIAIALYTGKK